MIMLETKINDLGRTMIVDLEKSILALVALVISTGRARARAALHALVAVVTSGSSDRPGRTHYAREPSRRCTNRALGGVGSCQQKMILLRLQQQDDLEQIGDLQVKLHGSWPLPSLRAEAWNVILKMCTIVRGAHARAA